MTQGERYFQIAITLMPSFAAAARNEGYSALLWPLNGLLDRHGLTMVNYLPEIEEKLLKLEQADPESRNDRQIRMIRDGLGNPGVRAEFEDSFRLVCRDGGYLSESRKDALWQELRTPVIKRFVYAFEFREIKLAA